MHSWRMEESTTATWKNRAAGIHFRNWHTQPPLGGFFMYYKNISNLNNEAILESIYEDLVVEFRTQLLTMTQKEIDEIAMKRFEDMSW